MSEEIKLTQFSSGSGCGCKIHPEALEEIIKDLKTDRHFPGLIVGNDASDDASVMELPDGNLLVQTSDFFTPIVDDPYLFGMIASANALSDVYAMGGKPLMANALLGWPLDKLEPSAANLVLQGASEICRLAGIPLAGGHSIKIQEPIFGLSVTGLCRPDHLKTNAGARTGDLIYMTKPLGTGILAAAHKRNQLSEEGYQQLRTWCSRLNKEGELFGTLPFLHAMTDVTGFGFLGHLLEMCHGANLGAEIRQEDLPVIPEARSLAAQYVFPDNTFRNWNAFEKDTQGLGPEFFGLVNDPQTNGGLLVAVDPASEEEFDGFCSTNQLEVWQIGRFIAGQGAAFV